MAPQRHRSEAPSLAIRDVMARAASTYGRIGPDFFSTAAEGFVEEAALQPASRVLDVGCGPGTVLAILRKRLGPQAFLVGTDLVLNMAVQARDRLGISTPIAVMDGQALGFAEHTFDAVLCAAAIYQMPDGQRAAAEMMRLLRPEGLLGLSAFEASDENWSGLSDLYAEYLPPLPASGMSYDRNTLPELLYGAGALGVRVVIRSLDVTYRDAADWLANAWSHGERRAFEAMDQLSYERFVEALPAYLELARGADTLLHWRPMAVYAFGYRAGNE